jgi:hypothetical protein
MGAGVYSTVTVLSSVRSAVVPPLQDERIHIEQPTKLVWSDFSSLHAYNRNTVYVTYTLTARTIAQSRLWYPKKEILHTEGVYHWQIDFRQ